MKILVSNDDGINSTGIYSLVNELKKIGEVIVVAPLTEQSAVGHAITMKNPLRVQKHYINGEFFGYAVSGTPADCVKMGIRNILDTPPDLVISGINHGSNAAINIIYSGTVSAAREAAIMDIPAIAISITSHHPDYFNYAAKVAARLALLVKEDGLQKGTCLNVNVPNLPASEINGIQFTTQGESTWDDWYEKRVDPYGQDYFWLTGKLSGTGENEGTDEYALKHDYVSVTPIHFDLTDNEVLERIKKWDVGEIK